MSICGQNAVFYGHTYSKFCDSGIESVREHREHTIYSMEKQRIISDNTAITNPTTNTNNPHLSVTMSDHSNRSFVGHHAHPAMNGLPTLMDHWPSPPMAHNHHHHINNSSNNYNNNNNNNSNSNNNGNNILGIQNQCNMASDNMDTSSMVENNNNNNSTLMKNSECPVITANDNCNNNNNNNNNNSSSSNNNNNNNNNSNNSSSSDCASHSDGETPNARHNQVGTIVLHGVAIVSLIIDKKERLCLAQISNTLLKEYSYNEIHNRRVALGITCVQCTPVQLEILRRAGAMPVSSRRCGMITKREAERLVKSFLEDNDPPKLPEDFAFDVIHECGWGCRGLFEPARYNSSRAKCIKCLYCSMYFSPNKFIFHFHRTPGAKYNHPDAANFNSWRRHLKLNQSQDKDEFTFKWEDVKAMFNGGTRKRFGSSASSSTSSASSSASMSSSKFSPHLSPSHSNHNHHHNNSHHNHMNTHHHQTTPPNRPASYHQQNPSILESGASSAKKAKTSPMLDAAAANSFLPKPSPPFSNAFNPYGWLGATTQNKAAAAAAYPFMAMNSAQSMCFGFPPHMPTTATNKDALMDRMKSSAAPPVPVGGNPASWMNRNPVLPFQLASMDLLWDKTFGFPSAAAVAALGGFRNGSYPSSIFPVGANNPIGMDVSEHLSPPRDNTPCMSPNPGMPQKLMSPGIHERGENNKGGGGSMSRTSAFTRVVPSMSPPSSASLSPQNSNIDRNTPNSRNDDVDDDEDVDDNDNNNNIRNNNSGHFASSGHDSRECSEMESNSIDGGVSSQHRDLDDTEEIDVEDHIDDKKRLKCLNDNNSPTPHSNLPEMCHSPPCNPLTPTPPMSMIQTYNQHSRLTDMKHHLHHVSNRSTVASPATAVGATSIHQLSLPSSPRSDDVFNRHCDNGSTGRNSALSGASETVGDTDTNLRDITKEDRLGEDAKEELGESKDVKEDSKEVKDECSGDNSREATFQEHMSKQLEMLRETLTTELEQERKIRYSLQEKLKQAHEALNTYSCGQPTTNNNNGDPNTPFKDGSTVPR